MYKIRYITPEENAQNVKYNSDVCIKNMVLRQSSPVDEFYMEKGQPADDEMESVSFVDPIIILFNQERLDSLGEMGVKKFLDSLQQKESSVEALRKQCSDDDLINMLKSRYLQTPSEIMAYCRYIEGNVEKFNEEVKVYLESQKQSAELSSNIKVEPQTSE